MYGDSPHWTKLADDLLSDLRSFLLPKESKSAPIFAARDLKFLATIWTELYYTWNPETPGGRTRRLHFLNERGFDLVKISQYLPLGPLTASAVREQFVQDVYDTLDLTWRKK